MMWNTVVSILTILQITYINCNIFHELSAIHLKPKTNESSNFGFSMAYQKSTQLLAIGAPSEGHHGKVYSCNLSTVINGTECEEVQINWNTLAPSSLTNKFYMGASISASSNFFFICAPLWSTEYKTSNGLKSDAFGTCFVVKPGVSDPIRYKGGIEGHLEYLKGSGRAKKSISEIKSGTGWSTLIDEPNDLVLIAKVSWQEDFTYAKNIMQEPLTVKSSFSNSWMTDLAKRKDIEHSPRNIGYALTAVNFFTSETVYAFSMTEVDMTGKIGFLRLKSKLKLASISNTYLVSEDVGTMFGAALSTANVNRDEFADLLVGAPAYSDDDIVECGALHIYLGGELKSANDPSRMRTIVGTVMGARFGSAIAAHDLDGDGLPEITASAPFGSSSGLVYVFSGKDIFDTLIKHNAYMMVSISDLKSTQTLQSGSKGLGSSLQFASDIDKNGCDDLAVGASQTGEVQIFKCVQSITVNMTAELVSEASFKYNNFTVNVCANVVYPEMMNNVDAVLNVTNTIIGTGALVSEPEFNINLSCLSCEVTKLVCQNVTVTLKNDDSSEFSFTTTAALDIHPILAKTDFNGSEVILSYLSRLNDSIDITRTCTGDDCRPQLTMKFLWSGSNPYIIGSSKSESMMLQVTNEGNSSHAACVWLRVSGAMAELDCATDGDDHWCYLPKPLRRGGQHSLTLRLGMTMPSNVDEGLELKAVLYDECKQPNSLNTSRTMYIPYIFTTDQVYVEGLSHSRQEVTDKEIIVDTFSVYTVHEYLITNNGTISWNNITAVISIDKKPFVKAYESMAQCERQDTSDKVTLHCTLQLLPDSTQKIIVTETINKSRIESNLHDNKFSTTSQLTLFLPPTTDTKTSSVTSVMTYKKDIKFANNKKLIIIVAVSVAILLLAVTITIMYKKKFFVRKQKRKLTILRQTVRRLSSRRTPSRKKSKPAPKLGSAPNLQCYTPRYYQQIQPAVQRRNSI